MHQNEITREKIELKVPGSNPMMAYAARPTNPGPHPGLLVFQEAYGVNSHIRNVTDRFAAQGYFAIAPELFHRTAPSGFQGDYKSFASVEPHYKAVTTEGAVADIQSAYDWLRSHQSVTEGEVYSVGYCMGGRISFLANTVVPLRAAVSYYGGGIAPGLLNRVSNLHGPALLIWGGSDKHIPVEQRKALTDALDGSRKVYVNVVFSNAGHGFFCDEREAYEPNAARQSFALALEFLRS